MVNNNFFSFFSSQRIGLMVELSNVHRIVLSQIHLAVTMKKEGQIVVADHESLKRLFRTDKLNRYHCFGLRKHGNFTAEALKPADSDSENLNFDDVSYVQVKLKPLKSCKKFIFQIFTIQNIKASNDNRFKNVALDRVPVRSLIF